MSAGITQPPPHLADMMQGIGQRMIMETLSTFFAYAAAHWTIEAFNYLPITFLLVVFAMTSKHPDPNFILGVNPQSCFEAVFGRIIRRSHPDWDFSMFSKHMGDKPFLGFIWEEKVLDKMSPTGDALMDMEGGKVVTSVENDMFSDIQQLQEQALCAFFHHVGDVVFAFLNYRECFFLFEFHRPSDWAALKSEYQARFPKPQKGKPTRSAVKFDKKDLPRPLIHYYARSLRKHDGSALNPVFLNAFRIATSHLGLLENQFPLFRMPPEVTKADLVQPNLEMLQKKLDKKIEERDAEPVEEPLSEHPSSDDLQDKDFATGSSSSHLSGGSVSPAVSESPVSAPVACNPGPSKGKSRRRRRRRHRGKMKQAALPGQEDVNDTPSAAGTQESLSSPPRASRTCSSRNVVPDSDFFFVGSLGEDAPKAVIRVQSTHSHGIILTDSDPASVDDPAQINTHKQDHSDKSYRLPGTTDTEDEDIDDQPAELPIARTAVQAPNASNTATGVGNSAAARRQRRVRPVASGVLGRDRDGNSTVGQRNAARTADLLQDAAPAQTRSGAEANASRSPLRARVQIASQTKRRDDGRGARSAAQSNSKQKRRHVGDSDAESDGPAPSSKKRKFPARTDPLQVESVADRSTMPVAGPSNSQRLASRGLATPRGRSVGKRPKNKGHAA